MERKVLLDSSVWIALFLDFDIQHAKAKQFFSRFTGTCVVPYCVISEVTTVLTYKHSRQQADNFLDYLETDASVQLIENELSREMDFYRSSVRSKISFTDGSLLHLSKKLGIKLVTFDQQLEKLAKK
jgi:predicted nucleic acid-binding protein